MYESFFGLTEKPFSLLPDPSFFYLSKIHREALTLVEYGLHNQTGFTVLTGEIGSGKTTLMRYLLDKLDDDVTVGLISHTHESLGHIMDWVCVAFDLKAPPGDKIQQHQALVDFLLDQYRQGKRALLIIDEAQNLGLDKLEEIRLLSNINADKDLMLQLLLLGQPQLRDLLRNPDLEQFVQRVSASYHLGRLNAEDTFYYIRHRLKTAGGRKDIFTPDACHAVYHYSRGIPRIINLICETALVFSYGAGEKSISGASIDGFVKSDASQLLLAVDSGDDSDLPDYTQVFQPDPAADDDHDEPADQAAAPDEAEIEVIEAYELMPDEIDARAAGELLRAPGDGNVYTVEEVQYSSVRKLEDSDNLSFAELIKPAGPRIRWSAELLAIAAGVILGVGLVAWYLYEKSQATSDVMIGGREGSAQAQAPAPQPAAAPQTAEPQPATPSGSPPVEQDSALLSVSIQPEPPPPEPVEPPPPSEEAQPQIEAELTPAADAATREQTEVALRPQPPEPVPDTPEARAAGLDAVAEALDAMSFEPERVDPETLRVNFGKLVAFNDGSTDLDQDAKAVIGRFASALSDASNAQLRVYAHTDSVGGKLHNLALSRERAKNTAEVMAGFGIDPSRITYFGLGEGQPRVGIAQEQSVGPWVNRRVEIEVVVPK